MGTYIDACTQKDKVRVWERNEDGSLTLKEFKAPYHFYTKSKNGKHESIYGDKLTKHMFDSRREFSAAKERYKEAGVEMFESDIQPHLRVLSDEYYEQEPKPLNYTLLDIETDYDPERGYSTIEDPYAPINAIAFCHRWLNKYVVLAVPPDGFDASNIDFVAELNKISPVALPLEVIIFKNEHDLLLRLLDEINHSDILSGWNSRIFDIPMIAKRVELTLGKNFVKKLSRDGAPIPKFKTIEVYGKDTEILEIGGRGALDYMDLYKKYELEPRRSYALASIADIVCPELPKLEYSGSLATLYRDDFVMFLRYNLRDVEILNTFEDDLGYLEIANILTHMSCGLFPHTLGTLKLVEFSIINYAHHEWNKIVNDLHPPDTFEKIAGAFVLPPKVGLWEWVGAIDLKSLYPSAIRSINISPETLVGQFRHESEAVDLIKERSSEMLVMDFHNGQSGDITLTAREWAEYLPSKKWAVSGFGTIFDQTSQGIVPAILEGWYNTRVKHQELKADPYHDRLQYIYKIKLNSAYGALCAEYFRFYNSLLGESTTATGRDILLHQCAETNKIIEGEYDSLGECVIYGDTDSTYFLTNTSKKSDAVKVADYVAVNVDKTFKKFMQERYFCTDEYDDIMGTSREVVARSGLFIHKKRYALRVVDNEGNEVDYLKITGLDTKKTTMPVHIAKKVNTILSDILDLKPWEEIRDFIISFKNDIRESDDIFSLGLPKGVKNVEKYTAAWRKDPKTFLPGHVAASICYNELIKKNNDHMSPKIISGNKIKVFYLKTHIGRFKAIAVPTDNGCMPQWYAQNHEMDMDAHIERLIDNPLDNILKGIDRVSPCEQDVVVDSFMDF